MSVLVGSDTRLLVQGITGREGEFHHLSRFPVVKNVRGQNRYLIL